MRGTKWISTILLITVFVTAQLFASTHPKGVEISNNGNGYIVNFSLPDYATKTINIEGEEYIKLFVDGFGTTSEIGLPALPQLTFDLLISQNESNPQATVLNANFTSVVLTE
jgi:hypothetical protein